MPHVNVALQDLTCTELSTLTCDDLSNMLPCADAAGGANSAIATVLLPTAQSLGMSLTEMLSRIQGIIDIDDDQDFV